MKQTLLITFAIFLASFIYAQDKKITEIKPADLPKGANTWISENLPGGKVTKAGKIEEKGVVSYAAVVEAKGRKHSYLFDKDGKFTGKGDNVSAAPKPPTSTTGPKPAPVSTPAAKGAPATTTKSSGTKTATEEAAPKK